jgi:CheY-like chemotaxis protein
MPKILLVEDNDMNRDMLSRRLERRGFEVATAADGELAIKAVELDPPDLILMDLSMPNMNGWEATEHLKSRPKYSDIPIVALTAHALDADRNKALDTGCDEFETKPLDFARLIEKVRALLEKSAA